MTLLVWCQSTVRNKAPPLTLRTQTVHPRDIHTKLLRSSHCHWELPPGRQDNSSSETMPRACSEDITVLLTSPAPVGIASVTAGPDAAAYARRVTSCSRFLKQSYQVFLFYRSRDGIMGHMLNIAAALLCLQVAKIHSLFTSTFDVRKS